MMGVGGDRYLRKFSISQLDQSSKNDFILLSVGLLLFCFLLSFHFTIHSGKKYLYIRKRELGKLKSEYVDVYSEELHNLLLRNNKEAKSLRKEIRIIEKQLAFLGYSEDELEPDVLLNLDFARKNMKTIIYDQAILEGGATSFHDIENIIDNGEVNNMKADDVEKILNLKHAWEFILDKDVIKSPSDYYLASYIAKLVNEGFYQEGGRIRGVPVTIGGSSYIPPIPNEIDVKNDINDILKSNIDCINIAIELCLYVAKMQIYNDGNKRTAVIYANHYLIAHGKGLLAIPADKVSEFKHNLIKYYEATDTESVKRFLKNCHLKMK